LWYCKAKSAPFPQAVAFDPDTAAVHCNQFFCKGKTQTGSSMFAGLCGTCLIEGFENVFELGILDTDASVGNGKQIFMFIIDSDTQQNRASIGG
jgi:hypothetical protein